MRKVGQGETVWDRVKQGGMGERGTGSRAGLIQTGSGQETTCLYRTSHIFSGYCKPWENTTQHSTRLFICVCDGIGIVGTDQHWALHTVIKGLAIFLSPAGMSLAKLFLAGNNLPSPNTRKVWSKNPGIS